MNRRSMTWLDEMPPVPEESLAAFLRTMIRERGLTQTELADLSGITQPRISEYIAGRTKTARKGTLEAFDKAFGLPRGTFYRHTYGEGAMAPSHETSEPRLAGLSDDVVVQEIIDGVMALADEPENLRRVRNLVRHILGSSRTNLDATREGYPS